MINEQSLAAVDGSTFSKCFRKPLYDSYCFSNIPGTIEKILVGSSELGQLPASVVDTKQYDKVILFFVDAFGWRFFEKYKDKYPTLDRFVKDGTVSKLTSQFPSTTAAHVTTIHTTKRVGESGVFEWFYYEPKLDTMIAPLLFSYAGDGERNTLEQVIEPAELFPHDSIYKRLHSHGINTYLFQSKNFTPSPFGNVVTNGVQHVNAFTDLESALTDLRIAVQDETGKAYFYFYYGNIDAAGHKFGPSSAEFENEVDRFFSALENLFIQAIEGKSGNTLLLMTADHGQTEIDPKTTMYLNQELPEIIEWTKRNNNGELLVVGGSCRDMFLYIKDECLEMALTKIRNHLTDKAEVYLVKDLLDQGFFGTNPSDVLRSRLGNICILPYKHDSVFWWEEGRFEQNFYGHHGGLTPEEMDTILLALPL